MTLTPPVLTSPAHIDLVITDSKHIRPIGNPFPSGQDIVNLEGKIGSDAVIRAGSFDNAMLKALDGVSAKDNYASSLAQQAIIDPESVDIHDITIAQAQATMSLDIARTVLNRLVQGWKEIINTR
jgi:flagellar hook-basal body complex protein FliE